MKCVEITPKILTGAVTPPPSKSIGHRAVICAALANGASILSPIEMSDDITATVNAANALGADISYEKGALTVNGGLNKTGAIEIDAHESGSTLRFFIPIALAAHRTVTFTGRGKLPTRPLQPYYEIFDNLGLEYHATDGGLPLTVSGILKPCSYKIRGDISSQFITGLLFALPLLDGDSEIEITTPLESAGYIDLTLDTLKTFGIDIVKYANRFIIKGNQTYKPHNYTIEGDFSQAAFWLTAGAIGSRIDCYGLNPASNQGDAAIINLLSEFGARISVGGGITCSPPSRLSALRIDAGQIPDLVPILAVAASFSQGETIICNAARLRIKECDRLAATCSELKKLGADIREEGDSLVINGKEYLDGGTCDGWNDHRIVMAMSIAAIRCKNIVTITGCEAINKSYPTFFEHYKMLGGEIREFDMGK